MAENLVAVAVKQIYREQAMCPIATRLVEQTAGIRPDLLPEELVNSIMVKRQMEEILQNIFQEGAVMIDPGDGTVIVITADDFELPPQTSDLAQTPRSGICGPISNCCQ